MEYRIVYNSDLIISNPTELSTFSIFYDKILLPYMADDGCVLRMTSKKGGFGLPSDTNGLKYPKYYNLRYQFLTRTLLRGMKGIGFYLRKGYLKGWIKERLERRIRKD